MMFLDALPQAGSTGSIMLMSELLQVESFNRSINFKIRYSNEKFISTDRTTKSQVVNLSAGTFRSLFRNS